MELIKTRGIILHQVKYSETSLIVKVYTELLGLQTYMAKGVRKKNASLKAALFQPLNMIDLVANHNPKKDIQYIRDISSPYSYKSIPYDIKKSTIARFINELLYKSIHEEISNKELITYICNALIALDEAPSAFSDFHLVFAMQLTSHLGFYPHGRYSSQDKFFDIMEGMFKPSLPDHTNYLEGIACQYFDRIINPENSSTYFFDMPLGIKKLLLEKIIDYYRLHIQVFGNIRSHLVLEEVLHG